MKIYFSIKQDISNVEEISHYVIDQFTRGDLMNFVLEADYFIYLGPGLYIEFEHLVINLIYQLNLNYNCLISGDLTEGRLFTIMPEWEYHFSFFIDGDYVSILFPQLKHNIKINKLEFESMIIQLTQISFSILEYYLPSIIKNINYINIKEEIVTYSFWRNVNTSGEKI